uniref:Uncharacterized protein n=1 Tax=Ascaris lumbricoides TaxID=6252 RepID=A0A9J2PES5_ASCLU
MHKEVAAVPKTEQCKTSNGTLGELKFPHSKDYSPSSSVSSDNEQRSTSYLSVPVFAPEITSKSDNADLSSDDNQSTSSIPSNRRESHIRRISLVGVLLKKASKDFGRTVKTAADGELRSEFSTFAQTTSAHGIPMAVVARRMYVKAFWLCLTLSLFIYFIYQCTLVFDKYQRNDKIVNVELQFESAPFPAITVCNLNPFKRHLARTVPQISETLDAFHQAVTYSKDAANHYASDRSRRNTGEEQYPGGFHYVQFEPVLSDCDCIDESDRDCKQKDSVPMSNYSICICNYDRQDSSAWPCFNATTWIESTCPDCNDIGYCNLPETNGSTLLPCLCQTYGKYCLIRPDRLKRIWEFRGKVIPDKSSPFRADFMEQLKQLGYENMTDEVAITTKTKERMVLTMAGLPVHRRIALSYGKSEFIHMCSFNGQQCDIIADFKLHVDPAFGNCYTFNANKKNPLMSSRAGPSYGLRLMVFVNATDYLPTTEATGVRIAIHGQDEYPFPDTFGYSAPTGAVSSFGLSMRKVNRLSQPYGDCVPADRPLPENYIYMNYKYEPEGCYKSCYQSQIYDRCGCADPRYPVQNSSIRRCDSFDVLSRNCLIREGIRFTRNHSCRCKHPCQQDVYTTTYSAAKWPSGSFQVGQCGSDLEKCISYYRLVFYFIEYTQTYHAAMIEIYYEQMSYEVLTESVSYLVVNLISDIGGQAGLWLGASVITLLEMVIFVFRILTIYCRRGTDEAKNKFSGKFKSDSHQGSKNKKTESSSCTFDNQITFEVTPPDDSTNQRGDADEQNVQYHNNNRPNSLNENLYVVLPE